MSTTDTPVVGQTVGGSGGLFEAIRRLMEQDLADREAAEASRASMDASASRLRAARAAAPVVPIAARGLAGPEIRPLTPGVHPVQAAVQAVARRRDRDRNRGAVAALEAKRVTPPRAGVVAPSGSVPVVVETGLRRAVVAVERCVAERARLRDLVCVVPRLDIEREIAELEARVAVLASAGDARAVRYGELEAVVEAGRVAAVAAAEFSSALDVLAAFEAEARAEFDAEPGEAALELVDELSAAVGELLGRVAREDRALSTAIDAGQVSATTLAALEAGEDEFTASNGTALVALADELEAARVRADDEHTHYWATLEGNRRMDLSWAIESLVGARLELASAEAEHAAQRAARDAALSAQRAYRKAIESAGSWSGESSSLAGESRRAGAVGAERRRRGEEASRSAQALVEASAAWAQRGLIMESLPEEDAEAFARRCAIAVTRGRDVVVRAAGRGNAACAWLLGMGAVAEVAGETSVVSAVRAGFGRVAAGESPGRVAESVALGLGFGVPKTAAIARLYGGVFQRVARTLAGDASGVGAPAARALGQWATAAGQVGAARNEGQVAFV